MPPKIDRVTGLFNPVLGSEQFDSMDFCVKCPVDFDYATSDRRFANDV